MIKQTNTKQATFGFNFTFCKRLSYDNRWVRLADQIPWEVLGTIYEESLFLDKGAPTISSRVVIGALIIKHMKNLSDEETIEDIRENPYYQYFLGYSSFGDRQVFAPSLFVEIRKRLGSDKLQRINETFLGFTEPEADSNEDKDSDDTGHKGMLIMDATAAPQDIAYPTDVGLLNEAREKLEEIIDELWTPEPGKIKPRTYRQKARTYYLSFNRKRSPRRKTVRKAIRKQLSYVLRDLGHIDILLDGYAQKDFPLSLKMQHQLWVIKELFRQQDIMYRMKTHSIPDRIVSISQPHVRPIVRGKARSKTEFGAKLSVSVIGGKVILDRLSWDAYNENEDLIPAVERYQERFGYYPKSVNADKIYWNRKNRYYLKSLGIEMYGGSPLGRPSKNRTLEEKKHQKLESVKRNRIEGAFGLGKRRYGLGLIMAKTRKASESWIAMVIFVMNVAGVYRNHILSYFFRNIRYKTGRLRSSSLHTLTKHLEILRTGWNIRTRYITNLQNVAF